LTPTELAFPPRLSLARCPTPLQLLSRASERWGQGSRIWVKRDDLTGSTLTGNKVRKLEYFAAHALEHGFDTLITCGGLQSNHARATAGVCAQLGLHCELVLRGDQPEDSGNTLLDNLFGAELRAVPRSAYARGLDALLEDAAEAQRSRGRKPLVIPTGGSNGIGIWGYIGAAFELADDMKAQGLDGAAVVTATGSGGTQAGLTLGMALADTGSEVIGMAVCDNADWFNTKVLADVEEARNLWPSLPKVSVLPHTVDDYIGPGYGVADPEVYSLIAELAALEGLILDPVYTGKAFYGLISEMAEGRFGRDQDVVFVHTGGIFGLFPHYQELRRALDRRPT